MAFAQKRAHSDATEDASLDFFPLNFKEIENSYKWKFRKIKSGLTDNQLS